MLRICVWARLSFSIVLSVVVLLLIFSAKAKSIIKYRDLINKFSLDEVSSMSRKHFETEDFQRNAVLTPVLLVGNIQRTYKFT